MPLTSYASMGKTMRSSALPLPTSKRVVFTRIIASSRIPLGVRVRAQIRAAGTRYLAVSSRLAHRTWRAELSTDVARSCHRCDPTRGGTYRAMRAAARRAPLGYTSDLRARRGETPSKYLSASMRALRARVTTNILCALLRRPGGARSNARRGSLTLCCSSSRHARKGESGQVAAFPNRHSCAGIHRELGPPRSRSRPDVKHRLVGVVIGLCKAVEVEAVDRIVNPLREAVLGGT